MRKLLSLLGLSLTLLLIWPAQGRPSLAAAPLIPRFESRPCPFDPPPGERIECGYLLVPENRSRPDSPVIRLGVMLLRSHATTPAPDPIIYLRGGLGYNSTKFVKRELSRLAAWLAKRDVLLFDQRGLEGSEPALTCPEVHQAVMAERLGRDRSLAGQLAARLVCQERWTHQGIDLAAYNSFETAQDVADLWQVLAYDQVNLIGSSYWTLVAQLLLRDYGHTGRIRSVVLDSPVPLNTPAMAGTPAQVAASLQRLFAECQADWLCRSAYPDLAAVYRQVFTRLQTAPVTLTTTHPLDGSAFTFQFGLADFGYLVQYNPYRQLPSLIYDIYDGDYRAIIVQWEDFIRDLNQINAGEHFGLRTTMNCNEPWQTISAEQRAAMAIYPEAAFMENPVDAALCARWPTFQPGPQKLARGDTPTLVLTGGDDPRLPATYGQAIVSQLSRGYHLHLPGAPHAMLNTGQVCPNLLVLNFLNDPTHSPQADCLNALQLPQFDTRFLIRAAAARRPVQLGLVLLGVGLIGSVISAGWPLRQPGQRPIVLAWSATARLLGWPALGVSAGLVLGAFYATQAGFIPFSPVQIVALIIPVVAGLQAAFLFSPEDEPALELLLATPRPPRSILLERLGVLLLAQSSLALLAGLSSAALVGESWLIGLLRWLTPLLCLSGLAVFITRLSRRAIFGVLIVCLCWVVLTVFGDLMIIRWPFTWPLHLYLPPSHAEYGLNRLFLAGLGVGLIALTAVSMSGHPEGLLLGRGKAKRSPAPGLRLTWLPSFARLRLRPAEQPSRAYVVNRAGLALTWGQLTAMARYEFILQWRRAALPAVLSGLIITPLIAAFIAYPDFQAYPAAIAAGSLAPEVARTAVTAAMLPATWLGALLTTILLLPLAVAETAPRDRQLGLSELLRALPLSPATYLLGKLIGLWLSLLVGIIAAALLAGGIWWGVAGPFHGALFLEVWFVGVTGLSLINAASSMLLAAARPTTRSAILIGGAYTLACLVGLSLALTSEAAWWRYLNPARPPVVLHYLLATPGAINNNDELTRGILLLVQRLATQQDVFFSLGGGLLQVGLLWLLAWWRWPPNHQD